MPSFLNFRGYTAEDPLDKASPSMRYVLAMIVTAVVSFSFFYIESVHDLKFVIYTSDWVIVVAVLLATFLLAPLVVTLRKSSSLVFFLMVLIPTFLADLYFQAHIRDHGGIAPWMYLPNTFIYAIPIPLRFLAAWSFDSFILGPLALWITRLVAMLVYAKKKVAPAPTPEQQKALFSEDWSSETVAKPHRDAAFGFYDCWVSPIYPISCCSPSARSALRRGTVFRKSRNCSK